MTADSGFGIDIGGSGIKGAPVDLHTGLLGEPRIELDTPVPSTPQAVAGALTEIVAHFEWQGPIGVTLPAVVKQGVAWTAANIDQGWIGTDAAGLFAAQLGHDPATLAVLNDADAAGIAEVRYSHPESTAGVTTLLTLGTGIGSALFLDGKLVPNTEFGHLEIDGRDAELLAAASVKDEQGLSYTTWAQRVNRYLKVLENLISPDRIILGGGISKAAADWVPLLRLRSSVLVASRHNDAGIVGAALAAAEGIGH